MPQDNRVDFASEIVIGFVAAVGTDLDSAEKTVSDQLLTFGYKVEPLRLSEIAEDEARRRRVRIVQEPEAERIRTHMDAGDKLRQVHGDDWLAIKAIAEIHDRRMRPPAPRGKTAYILRSLKHPKEVETLRRVYGPGFFLISLYATEAERFEYLTTTMRCSAEDARKLIRRDLDEEEDEHGQRTRKTFALGDVFVHRSSDKFEQKLRDFLSLAFGYPFITPEPDEYAMFLAFAASLRSAQLGRQVGAVVVSELGDVIGTGCNDVPSGEGGLYWPGPADRRDHTRKYDSNDRRRDELVTDVFAKLNSASLLKRGTRVDVVRGALASSALHEITEYGRAVHAEMEALLSCARNGVSVVGSTLYTTTFPCHNCAKHIAAAGVSRVVYVEPYPKSKATELHDDAIAVEEADDEHRVAFTPFIGVGPRRFIELFSLEPGPGRKIERKRKDGTTVKWVGEEAQLRAPMPVVDYLQLETAAKALTELGRRRRRQRRRR